MKEHFSPKSIVFYGCAIACVTVLFSITTAQGEKKLQAPRRIDGRYPLSLSSPPDCLWAKSVNLLLQQSGVFLTGSLLPSDASEQAVRIAQERPSLSGQWHNDQLMLEGQLGRDWNCQSTVKLEGTVVDHQLNGTLRLSATPDAIAISAQREAPPRRSVEH
ncbi:MAG: hypothetical protein IGS48_08700 [Oscillatoriales cyanobacterium C42_A2020_001]|nr:hypothetical protein [Leptolyngbyaceae cyanobacterium C42_A2020_001]